MKKKTYEKELNQIYDKALEGVVEAITDFLNPEHEVDGVDIVVMFSALSAQMAASHELIMRKLESFE